MIDAGPREVGTALVWILTVGWAVLHILVHKRSVSALAWLGLVLTAPLVGAVLYAMIGVDRLGPRARARRSATETVRIALDPLTAESQAWYTRRDAPRTLGRPLDELHVLLERIGPYREVAGNHAEVLRGGDEAFPRMLGAIESARNFVFLETYIWKSDAVGREFLDALARAAGRGVRCCAIFDGFGATRLRRRDIRRAAAAGVSILPFSPVRGLFGRFRFNHRTHRKLLVVDGAIAYLGGVNLAQEYATNRRGVLKVRDHHFELRGPVVQQLTRAFVEDWHVVSGERLTDSRFFPPVRDEGHDSARTIPSGPDDERDLFYAAVLAAISEARGRVRLATPFFIPEPPLSMALEVAALGGVEIQLLLPVKSDHFFTDQAREIYLDPLLEAGVQIRKAPPPFLHSKLTIVDSQWACVGSSNLDPRSLRLNFELNVGIEGRAVSAIERAFEEVWVRSEPLSADARRGRGLLRRAWESFWALWSPLL